MTNQSVLIDSNSYSTSIAGSLDQLGCEGFYQPVIFSSVEWFRLQEKILDTDFSAIRIYICADRHSSVIRLIFPFYTMKSSRLGFIEEGLFSLSNYYSPYYSPPGADESDHHLLTCVIGEILKPQNFSYMVLRPIDIGEKSWLSFIAILKSQCWVTICELEFGNWYHKVDGTYSDYFDARPSNVRNTYKRKRRLFDRIENSRIEIVRNGNELSNYIRDYLRVYEKSWKQEEPHAQFMPELIRLAASRGELRLGFAYIGEVPIAAHFWLVSANVASIFKLSYDESYSRFSPGTLVMCKMLEYVLDIDQVYKIDFLSGDDLYKQDWMSSRREMKAVYAYNLLSVGGVLRFACHSGKNIVRWISTLVRYFTSFSESAVKVPPSS